ncbi:MAG: type IV pilin protein [Janthinobacterium lividum]
MPASSFAPMVRCRSSAGKPMPAAQMLSSHRCKFNRAFTLIEMLIIIAISGILALIAYPSYREAMLKSRRAEGRAALSAAMLEQERWFSSHNSYQVFSAANANGFRWHSGQSAAGSAYELGATACPGELIGNCVLLTAQPGTALVNRAHQDAECGQLSLDSTGQRAASGPGQACW